MRVPDEINTDPNQIHFIMPIGVDVIHDLPIWTDTHEQEGRLGDSVGAVTGRGDAGTGDEGRSPLEEDEGRRGDVFLAGLAAAAPEADEVVPLGEGAVEKAVGDVAVAPFVDLGLGSPAPGAEAVPELAVVPAEGDEALRCAGEVGNLRGREEGEDAELDILREIRE